MQLQSFKRYSPENYQAHLDRVKAKSERINILSALLDMHCRDERYDRKYVSGLRKRLRCAQNELKNMVGE